MNIATEQLFYHARTQHGFTSGPGADQGVR